MLVLNALVAAGVGVGGAYVYEKKCHSSSDEGLAPIAAEGTATTAPAQAAASPPPVVQGLPQFSSAAKRAIPASVHIQATRKSKVVMQKVPPHPFQRLFPEIFGNQGPEGERERAFRTPPARAFGSGVIVSADGYIVTNQHVVGGADEVEVSLSNDVTYKAEVVGEDADLDVALLKVKAKGLPFLRFGDSDALQIGDWVLAVGTPFGTKLLSSTVTHGIVSAKGRERRAQEGRQKGAVIQIDATINPGSSGGALVNLKGEIVGINNSILTQSGTFNGYGFAIPSNLVKKIVSDLRQYGTVQRGIMGLYGIDVAEVSSYLRLDERFRQGQKEEATPPRRPAGLPELKGGEKKQIRAVLKPLKAPAGILVLEAIKGQASARAGLKKYDIITHIDKRPVRSFAELEDNVITRYNPGNTVQVGYLRKGKRATTSLTLDKAPGKPRLIRKDVEGKRDQVEVDGAVFEDLSESVKKKYKLDEGGVQLIKLTNKEKPWKKAELKEGFIVTSINRMPVKNVTELTRAMATLEAGQWVQLAGVDPRIKSEDKRKGYLIAW